jgi:hypothetical protein
MGGADGADAEAGLGLNMAHAELSYRCLQISRCELLEEQMPRGRRSRQKTSIMCQTWKIRTATFLSLSLSLVSLRLMYGYLSLVLSAKAALMKNTGMQGSGMGPMRSGGVYGERPTSRDHGHGLLSQTRSVVLNIYLLRTRDATPALASPEAATGT